MLNYIAQQHLKNNDKEHLYEVLWLWEYFVVVAKC